jgi:hypothetical protein
VFSREPERRAVLLGSVKRSSMMRNLGGGREEGTERGSVVGVIAKERV